MLFFLVRTWCLHTKKQLVTLPQFVVCTCLRLCLVLVSNSIFFCVGVDSGWRCRRIGERSQTVADSERIRNKSKPKLIQAVSG